MHTKPHLKLRIAVLLLLLLPGCHHHKSDHNTPPRHGYQYNSPPRHRGKSQPHRHQFNNLQDYNNDTLAPYEITW